MNADPTGSGSTSLSIMIEYHDHFGMNLESQLIETLCQIEYHNGRFFVNLGE